MNSIEAVELCDEILDSLGELPEAAASFSESIEEKVSSMKETIQKSDNVSPNQEKALVNMKEGVQRWLERS